MSDEETTESTIPTVEPEGQPELKFTDMDLSDMMLAALAKIDYEKPSPVQAGVIPLALEGKDVLGQARTGTGKTASFAIPILEMLAESKKGSLPQAIVLVPTRELAVQVRDEFGRLSDGSNVRCVPIYGGKPIKSQIQKLERGCEVVIGTPGRVLDLLGRGALNLAQLRCVVLDEADRMLDIGFRPDIEKILRSCPKQRQTLLLSATVAPGVKRLAERYMNNPVMLDFSPKTKSVDTIEQHYFTVDAVKKFELLVRLLEREQPTQAIVFCRTKRGTDKIYNRLNRKRKGVDCIHGDLAQGARDRVMREFREGNVKVLVATDVVGRGIDVTGISHIINYDIPQSSDDYVHRVGRTGRMGREGVAYTFVTPEEGIELTRIEVLINKLLSRDEIEGFETVASVATRTEKTEPAVRFFGHGAAANEEAPKAAAEAAPEPAEPPKEEKKPGDPSKRRKRHRKAL
ncbi:DEAD-box ATP-dependent RNA helicase CshA [Pseudobythopirellula maris]|uniref:DEAD-box ATP-dependent RNA helicase CshA n=1 Tax=Pseudobythopirellula maris TaxID=2527991 RepID=A0A5C5ZU75_9BACT|nr:DEAD/DEAH box helicase [Pseudobythopirellula maris]TWT90989.1 DEAD-box ATP-dependent RNA helicase CshA [Pseudobythopirellula maris]